MPTRTITSTEAQNNFGQIIDAVVQETVILLNACTTGNNDEFVRLSSCYLPLKEKKLTLFRNWRGL